ncbi:hypothetical protein D3C87_2142680 [compost metagenome]
MRRQHSEKVPGEDAQNADVKQVGGQTHAFFIQHLTGAGAPAVLPVIVAQPTADQENRPRQIGVNIEEEQSQKLHD